MLDLIAARPGLYLGEKSITLLGGWVYGWTSALAGEAFDGTNPPFREFHDWVALRLGFYESTAGWRRMLLDKHQGTKKLRLITFLSCSVSLNLGRSG